MSPLTELAALLGAGAVTGLVGSILGIGGGLFLVPALVLFFGVAMHEAAAASLVAVIATSTMAASVYVRNGTANIRLGAVLEGSTVLGALTGAFLAALIPGRALIGLFAAVLACVSVLLWRREKRTAGKEPEAHALGLLGAEYHDPAARKDVRYAVRRVPGAMGVAFGAGNLASMLGIGGGVANVPAMHLLCGVPMKAAAATNTFIMGVTAATGAMIYFARGIIDPVLAGTVSLGVFCGATLGTRVIGKLKDNTVRRAFALFTLVLAVQMLRRALHGG